MYYRGRRRRRFDGGLVLKILLVLLALAIVATAVIQTLRMRTVDETIRGYKDTIAAQETELEALRAAVPEELPADLSGEPMAYQALYPEMKVEPFPVYKEQDAKNIYLTFDDGPSGNTVKILDALKAADKKAAFFLVAKEIPGHEDVLRRMAAEGHTIGIHAYAHDYKGMYASVEAFLEDFNKAYTAIEEACGVKPTVFRFPGGSINSYNMPIYQQIIAEMSRRGFVYYDWSVSGEDATGKNYTPEQLTKTVLEGVKTTQTRPIVLLHDTKKDTAAAVPAILEQLAAAGYTCAPLTNEVKPVTFGYR